MNRKRNYIIAVVSTALITAAVCFSVSAGLFYSYNRTKMGTALWFSSNITPAETAKFNDVKQKLEKYYYQEIDEHKLFEGSIAGMAAAVGDPYTVYFTKDEMQEFMEKSSGIFSGIGVWISTDPKDHLLTVISPIEGSPAEKVGIQPGDKIIAVDGVDVSLEKDEDKVINMIKGPEGTNVKITVYRSSIGSSLDFEITRQKIYTKSISSKVMDDNIGYIRITQFDADVAKEFEENLNSLLEQNVKGFIIDLRDNPGGSYDQVLRIADRILPKGVIVYTEDRNGRRDYQYSDANELNYPLAVLVNEYSASASEILAGAIKDHKKGDIIGVKTFGKGLVQTLFPLSDGSGLKVTIQKYFTPSGNYIHEKGIEPDIVVENPPEVRSIAISQLELSQDLQLQKALENVKSKIK